MVKYYCARITFKDKTEITLAYKCNKGKKKSTIHDAYGLQTLTIPHSNKSISEHIKALASDAIKTAQKKTENTWFFPDLYNDITVSTLEHTITVEKSTVEKSTKVLYNIDLSLVLDKQLQSGSIFIVTDTRPTLYVVLLQNHKDKTKWTLQPHMSEGKGSNEFEFVGDASKRKAIMNVRLQHDMYPGKKLKPLRPSIHYQVEQAMGALGALEAVQAGNSFTMAALRLLQRWWSLSPRNAPQAFDYFCHVTPTVLYYRLNVPQWSENPDKLASGFVNTYKKHILRLIREAGHRTVTAKVMEHVLVFFYRDTLTKVSLAAGLTGAEVIRRRRRRISI